MTSEGPKGGVTKANSETSDPALDNGGGEARLSSESLVAPCIARSRNFAKDRLVLGFLGRVLELEDEAEGSGVEVEVSFDDTLSSALELGSLLSVGGKATS